MRFETQSNWHRKVDNALARIFDSLEDRVSFRKIAEEVYASPFHFHRMFRELTGETVKECFRRLGIERAIYQLRNSNKSVTEIAFDAGYERVESFNKAFRKTFGMTPTSLRKFPFWQGKLYSKAGIHYSPDNSKRTWFYIKPKGAMDMEVKIVNLPAKKHLCLRNIGNYWNLPQVWQKFMKTVVEKQLIQHNSSFMIIFHDHLDKIPMEKKRSDVSMTFSGEIEVPEDFFSYESEGGLYAITTHFGSSEEIGETWDRWRKEWLPASGWQLDDSRPSFEWYQNNPETVPPELHLTFLCDPVKKS